MAPVRRKGERWISSRNWQRSELLDGMAGPALEMFSLCSHHRGVVGQFEK